MDRSEVLARLERMEKEASAAARYYAIGSGSDYQARAAERRKDALALSEARAALSLIDEVLDVYDVVRTGEECDDCSSIVMCDRCSAMSALAGRTLLKQPTPPTKEP